MLGFGKKGLPFLLVALLLTGCFREAGPGIAPTIGAGATLLPGASPTLLATPTAFVTPFTPGQGPDVTAMPTLAGPTPTVALVVPGATGTVPFAAGPTYTPIPGMPTATLAPTQGLQPTPTALDQAEPCVYRVQPGDTAYHIATTHNVTLAQLIEANSLADPNRLTEGQELVIPNCGTPGAPQPTVAPAAGGNPPAQPTAAPSEGSGGQTIHVVQAGENLFRIALRYGVTVDEIVAANNLGSPEAILQIGQQLVIP